MSNESRSRAQWKEAFEQCQARARKMRRENDGLRAERDDCDAEALRRNALHNRLLAEAWDEGRLVGHSDFEEGRYTPNPYCPTPPAKTTDGPQ